MKPKKHAAKYQCLRQAVTDFAIEIGYEADKEKYNKAWKRFWRTVDKLEIFRKAE